VTDDLNSQIGQLHQHIQNVSDQIKGVAAGQERLHKDHIRLSERVDHLERAVSKDISDLAAHEREANLYRSHLIEGFAELKGSVDKLDGRFARHAEQEEVDRKEVLRGQQITIRSILLAAATIAMSGFVLLWQTGVAS
jgi:septal ring factor EnvC (AmiA/AmiB activator)